MKKIVYPFFLRKKIFKKIDHTNNGLYNFINDNIENIYFKRLFVLINANKYTNTGTRIDSLNKLIGNIH